MSGWAVIAERHVVPLDDLREHITDTSCWCAPSADTDDGQAGALYVHHSADHRTMCEEYDDTLALEANRLQDRVVKLETALRDCRATLIGIRTHALVPYPNVQKLANKSIAIAEEALKE